MKCIPNAMYDHDRRDTCLIANKKDIDSLLGHSYMNMPRMYKQYHFSEHLVNTFDREQCSCNIQWQTYANDSIFYTACKRECAMTCTFPADIKNTIQIV